MWIIVRGWKRNQGMVKIRELCLKLNYNVPSWTSICSFNDNQELLQEEVEGFSKEFIHLYLHKIYGPTFNNNAFLSVEL